MNTAVLASEYLCLLQYSYNSIHSIHYSVFTVFVNTPEYTVFKYKEFTVFVNTPEYTVFKYNIYTVNIQCQKQDWRCILYKYLCPQQYWLCILSVNTL